MIQVSESKGAFSVTRCRLIEPCKGLRSVGCTCATALGLHLVGGKASANAVKGRLAHRRKSELLALLSVEAIDRCRTFAGRSGVEGLQCCLQQFQRGWFDALAPVPSRSHPSKESQTAPSIPS